MLLPFELSVKRYALLELQYIADTNKGPSGSVDKTIATCGTLSSVCDSIPRSTPVHCTFQLKNKLGQYFLIKIFASCVCQCIEVPIRACLSPRGFRSLWNNCQCTCDAMQFSLHNTTSMTGAGCTHVSIMVELFEARIQFNNAATKSKVLLLSNISQARAIAWCAWKPSLCQTCKFHAACICSGIQWIFPLQSWQMTDIAPSIDLKNPEKTWYTLKPSSLLRQQHHLDAVLRFLIKDLVSMRSLRQGQGMCNDYAGVQVPLLNAFQ